MKRESSPGKDEIIIYEKANGTQTQFQSITPSDIDELGPLKMAVIRHDNFGDVLSPEAISFDSDQAIIPRQSLI